MQLLRKQNNFELKLSKNMYIYLYVYIYVCLYVAANILKMQVFFKISLACYVNSGELYLSCPFTSCRISFSSLQNILLFL